MGTKYGGGFRTYEPHRPGPKNPPINDARAPTVDDAKDRIANLKRYIPSLEEAGNNEAVKFLFEEIKKLEDLIKGATKNIKG